MRKRGDWQKLVPWWRWLPLMLSDSTEQIIIKHTLSLALSLSLCFSLTLPELYPHALSVLISGTCFLWPSYPFGHSVALLLSHTDKSTLLFTIRCFHLPPCLGVKQCTILYIALSFFFFFFYGVLLRHFHWRQEGISSFVQLLKCVAVGNIK